MRKTGALIGGVLLVALLAVATFIGVGGTPTTGTTGAVTVKVASLKGPTSMGIAKLMDDSANGRCRDSYDFTISGTADEVLPSLIQGKTDIALVPANAAAVLYNKTGGAVRVIDVNTLGVLYVVSADQTVSSLSDLAGRTVYMTGKGTTPEYVMDYLLEAGGLSDKVTLEYRSEATELAALCTSDPTAVVVLPEPYATSVGIKTPSITKRVSLTDEWARVQGGSGSQLVTGVTVVRTAFLEQHPDAVTRFIAEQRASVAYAVSDPAAAAPLVVKAGIVDSAAIAEKALPSSNLVCYTGDTMRNALSGYLGVLYAADHASVGGALPADDFYYGISAS